MEKEHPPQPADLPTDKDWEEMTKNLLRAEMMRKGVSFARLPELLEAVGVSDNEPNLRNKVGRGRFSATFFLQCLMAIGVDRLQVPDSVGEAAKPGGAQGLAKTSGKRSN